MSLMDEIASIYAEKERLAVSIPEWNITLYFLPYTGRERDRLQDRKKGEAELLSDFLILKAQLEDGTNVFDRGDKPRMMRVPVKILDHVVQQVLDWTPESLDPGN